MQPTFTSTFIFGLLLAATSTDFAIAHGDESHGALSRRNDHMAHSRRALEKCSEKLRSRDRIAQRYAKRNEMIDEHLSKRKLTKRDGCKSKYPSFNCQRLVVRSSINIYTNVIQNIVSLNPALAKRDLTTVVDLESLFPAEPECLLAPELTIGPYCKYSFHTTHKGLHGMHGLTKHYIQSPQNNSFAQTFVRIEKVLNSSLHCKSSMSTLVKPSQVSWSIFGIVMLPASTLLSKERELL